MRKLATLGSIFLVLASCASVDLIETSRNILNFTVAVTSLDESTDQVQIAGFIANSALTTKEFRVTFADLDATVQIFQVLGVSGAPPKFAIGFQIPKSVQNIYFGSKELIWKR